MSTFLEWYISQHSEGKCPVADDSGHFGERVLRTLTRSFEDLETMVGSVDEMKRRSFTELFYDRFEQIEHSKRVARAAQEKHRHHYRREVIGTFCVRLAGRVQGKGKEDEAFYMF